MSGMQNVLLTNLPEKPGDGDMKDFLRVITILKHEMPEMAFVGGCISLSFCDGNLLWKVYFIIFSYHSHHHKNRCRPPKRASLHSGVIPSDWAPYKKQCIRWLSFSWRIAFCIMRKAIMPLTSTYPCVWDQPCSSNWQGHLPSPFHLLRPANTTDMMLLIHLVTCKVVSCEDINVLLSKLCEVTAILLRWYGCLVKLLHCRCLHCCIYESFADVLNEGIHVLSNRLSRYSLSLLQYLMSVKAKDPPSAKSLCSIFIGTFFVASARILSLQAEMDGFMWPKLIVPCWKTLIRSLRTGRMSWRIQMVPTFSAFTSFFKRP